MAAGIVYLDVDDEITSAAARIRGSEATKIALVVPHGSRIATSRMNFRLLSREAVVNNRRLSIVAADPAARALAASAGLPVFASVAEHNAAGSDANPTAGNTATTGAVSEVAGAAASAAAATTAAATKAAAASNAPPTPAATTEPGPKPTTPAKRRKKGAQPEADETRQLALPAGPVVAAGAPAAAPTIPPSTAPAWVPRRLPNIQGLSLPRLGSTATVAATVILLAVVVVAVAGYLFLPVAEIRLTPRQEAIGPFPLVVRADPDIVSPDATLGVVPADRLEVPVSVSNAFTTTGRRIEEGTATGSVTFFNKDFTATNTIPGGSTVSTPSGVKFKTVRAVTVAKATLVGLTIVRSEADVPITAVKPGLSGNVEPNAITIIPASEDPLTLDVRNKSATTGGTHEEFPVVNQQDVDAAMASLRTELSEAFNSAVAGGAGAPANATVFPETATLGEATPTGDPATLVGREAPTFELGLAATGTVIAVDDSPVEEIARTRILANVGSDYRLVESSVVIEPGDPTVADGVVSFPVTARAARVRILDAEELLARIKGQPVDRARAILDEFGDVELSTWPGWVSSIPNIDARVSLEIVGQGAAGSASGPPGPSGPAADGTTAVPSPSAAP